VSTLLLFLLAWQGTYIRLIFWKLHGSISSFGQLPTVMSRSLLFCFGPPDPPSLSGWLSDHDCLTCAGPARHNGNGATGLRSSGPRLRISGRSGGNPRASKCTQQTTQSAKRQRLLCNGAIVVSLPHALFFLSRGRVGCLFFYVGWADAHSLGRYRPFVTYMHAVQCRPDISMVRLGLTRVCNVMDRYRT
jgi:hypothetical protein